MADELSKTIQMKIQDKDGNWVILYPKTKLECILGAENIQEQINSLNEEIENLKYKAITITKFTSNVNVIEIGSTVSKTVLTWTLSTTPATQNINNTIINNSLRTYTSSESYKTDKTFKLTVTDSKNATASQSITVRFYNGVYYGASSSTTYNSTLISGFTKALTNTKARTITVNAGTGQYIYYCIPSRFGTCTFTVNGFNGGFDKVSTISFKNSSGYSENYDIWKSTNPSLGNTKITIS